MYKRQAEDVLGKGLAPAAAATGSGNGCCVQANFFTDAGQDVVSGYGFFTVGNREGNRIGSVVEAAAVRERPGELVRAAKLG